MMTERIAEEVGTLPSNNVITFKKREKMPVPVMAAAAFPKKGNLYLGVKRVFDVTASCVGLVVLSPVLLLIALAIKFEDGGPVFFVQERVGKDEKVFRMYKFRSMCVNAQILHQQLLSQNELDGPAFKMKYDPRVTKVGKFIRKILD